MAEPQIPQHRMTSEEFLDWYSRQPDGSRYELMDGLVYDNRMQGERIVHAETKMRVSEQFRAQIRALNLPCQGFGDGMAVRIDGRTNLEPDAMVRCGPRLPGDAIVVDDPLIVVEVVSPSSERIDALTKLTLYFNNPHIQHYLIVIPHKKQAIQHRRTGEGRIDTSIGHEGTMIFDPPGIALDLDRLFLDLD